MKQTLTKRGQKSKADQIEPTSYYCVIIPQTAQDIEYLDTNKTNSFVRLSNRVRSNRRR
jgi:hypothetical protein